MKFNFKALGKSMSKSKSTAGIIIGGILLITTAILAAKAAPVAKEKLNKAEQEKGSKLTAKETVKTVAKDFVPAAITAVAGTACLVAGATTGAKEAAALATAVVTEQKRLDDYKKVVSENVSDEVKETIHEQVAKNAINASPEPTKKLVNRHISDDDSLIVDAFEPLCGTKFAIRKLDVEKAVLNFNRKLQEETYCSLNELYDEINTYARVHIPHTDLGEIVGWNSIHGNLDFIPDAIVDDDGKMWMVVNLRQGSRTAPSTEYMRW